MYFKFITLLALALLTGCTTIPYEKPQDQLNIQKDLSLKPEEIVTMTQVNWCAYAYGADSTAIRPPIP
ncbi:hypothetical protein [Pseudomonas sp. PS01302]|uniref:hypothetical protein n=1 Tax=Pseudomonas sp. PS01302 TaxID=2991438 RepID=UPI00249C137A|nr:hypothetical protein [Pseudomonas sp. PS01302]